MTRSPEQARAAARRRRRGRWSWTRSTPRRVRAAVADGASRRGDPPADRAARAHRPAQDRARLRRSTTGCAARARASWSTPRRRPAPRACVAQSIAFVYDAGPAAAPAPRAGPARARPARVVRAQRAGACTSSSSAVLGRRRRGAALRLLLRPRQRDLRERARWARTCAAGACRSWAAARACGRSSTSTTPPRATVAALQRAGPAACTTSSTTSPRRSREWLPALAQRRSARPRPRRVPAPIARLAAGSYGVATMTTRAGRLQRARQGGARLDARARQLARGLPHGARLRADVAHDQQHAGHEQQQPERCVRRRSCWRWPRRAARSGRSRPTSPAGR